MPKMPSMPSARNRPSTSKLRRGDAGSGAGLVTIIFVVISLVVFTISVREDGNGFFSSARSVVQTVVSPLRMAGAAVCAPFSGMGNIVRNLTAEEKTLSDLKAENERLSARNVELEEAEITARQLQELLDLKSSYNLQSTAARVIAGSTDSWTSSATIDKGSASGIGVGMPVVNSRGAVGQVISSAATTSTVRLLSDESSSVSAMIQSGRAQGMLRGSPDGTIYLSFIRTDNVVNPGDVVVTSGLGGVFPKGLPLGKVSSVESSPGSTYYTIVVEPFTTVANLEEVLVVTSLTEEQEATAEDIAAADAADLEAASGQRVEAQDKRGEDKGDSDQAKPNETSENEDQGSASSSTNDSVVNGSSSSARSSSSSSTQTSRESGRTDGSEGSDEAQGYTSPHDTSGRVG